MTQYFNGKWICDLPAGKNQAVYSRGDNGTFLALKVTPAAKSSFLHHLLPPKQNWSQMGSQALGLHIPVRSHSTWPAVMGRHSKLPWTSTVTPTDGLISPLHYILFLSTLTQHCTRWEALQSCQALCNRNLERKLYSHTNNNPRGGTVQPRQRHELDDLKQLVSLPCAWTYWFVSWE